MEGLAGVIIAKRISLLIVIAQKAIPEGTVRYLQVRDNSVNIFSWPTPNNMGAFISDLQYSITLYV